MRVTAVTVALIWWVVSLASVPLAAQDWDESFMLDEVLLRKCDDPSGRGNVAVPKPMLILETDEKGSRAIVRAGVHAGKKNLINVELSRPVTSGGTTLATLDGLSDSTTLELNATWVLWDPAAYAPAMRAAWGDAPPDMAVLAAKPKLRRSDARTAARWVESYDRAYDAAMRALQGRHPIYLNVNASASRNDFAFVDSSTLRGRSQSRTDRTFGASIGTMMKGKYYAELSYSDSSEFSAGRTATLCDPFGNTGVVECRKLVVEPPQEGDSANATFELRRLFRTSLGFAARVSRDFEANVTEVDVPIYFLQKMGDSMMELNGGIGVSWRSDTEDYSVRVFVGPALRL